MLMAALFRVIIRGKQNIISERILSGKKIAICLFTIYFI